jgi:hypothetical protein
VVSARHRRRLSVMTENIGLRLRFKDLYIVVTASATEQFSISITDAKCKEPENDAELLEALEFLQHQVDNLRNQVWRRITKMRPTPT